MPTTPFGRLLLALTVLLAGLSWFGARAQPIPAPQLAAANCTLQWSFSKLYVRELTGNNDAPEIDAWARATGTALRSSWCGLFQWADQKACGLPVPAGAAGSYNWFRDARRTYYVRGSRGALTQVQLGHKVGFYYSNLGRIGHIGLVVRESRATRRGRPARGYIIRAGNTGRGGGRDGAGVKDVFYASQDIYAAANWLY